MSPERITDPNAFATELFDGLPDKYDKLGKLLSFGQDRRWRKEMVRNVALVNPKLVLDVATGPAGVALAIRAATGAMVVGLDLTAPMLAQAQKNLVGRGESNVVLVQGRGEQLPFPDAMFDVVDFTYLLRYVSNPSATITELARVVKPGGLLTCLEFAVPRAPITNLLWRLYTRGILPVAGFVFGGAEWYRVGGFLGPNISSFYRNFPLEDQLHAWHEAGVTMLTVRQMSLGGGIVISGYKRADT